jgi:hypothetical protein
LTIGEDIATVNLVYKVRGQDMIGRQSQSWVKFPDVDWKVISAHVSTVTTDSVQAWVAVLFCFTFLNVRWF